MRISEFVANFLKTVLFVLVVAGTAITHAGDASQATGQSLNPSAKQWKGKPVTLRVGKGLNAFAADGIADVLEADGCPVTVTNEGGRFKGTSINLFCRCHLRDQFRGSAFSPH